MTESETIITLHRYYIWANKMRDHFDLLINTKNQIEEYRYEIEAVMYMSLWYACLYVVIEGWQELRLSDDVVNKLLESEYVQKLKRYRNGVFHFQKEYKDIRFEELDKEKGAVEWIRKLNSELGRFFLQELQGASPAVL